MPTEIDSLQIKINAEAVKANNAIDKLVRKLDKLATSLGKINSSSINGLANGVDRLGKAMQTMKDVKKTDFNKVARGISAFEKIDSAKLSSLSTTLSPLATSIGTLGAVKFDNKNIQTLINSLTRLSNANLNSLANVNFTQFGNSINQLSASLSNTPKIQQSVISMTNAIANLSKSGANMPIVATSLQTLGGSLSNFMSIMASAPSVTDSTVTFTQAISSLANAGAKAGVTASNLGVLGAQLKNLMATLSTAPLVSQNVIDMTNALANLSTQGSKVGSASRNIQRSLNGTHSSTVKASKGFNGLASAIGKFYASYFLVIRGVKGLWRSIESTADYIEAYNYFNVALGKIGQDWAHEWGKYAKEIGVSSAEEYADSFKNRLSDSIKNLSGLTLEVNADGSGMLSSTGMKNLGLNIQEVTQYASQLASVTNSVGQTGEVSLATASALTKLGADMSSLFNIDYSSVMTNLQSGIIGQSRALYKYGIDITNATLQTKAYELGLTKSVSEMTQMEKMQLRTLVILQDSRVAWGDLANTISSPSNMMRQFRNNLKETGMLLGQLFIPLLTKVAPVINGITVAIGRLLTDFASLFGIKIELDKMGQGFNQLEEELDDTVGGFEDATDAVKEFKNQMLGFDEAEKLTTINATSNLDGTGSLIDLSDEILNATSAYEKVWQQAYDKMNSGTQLWADKIEKTLVNVKRVLKDIVLGDYIQAGEDFSKLTLGLTNFVGNAIRNVDWGKAGKSIGEFLAGVDWLEIFVSIADIVAGAIEGAVSVWFSSLKEAPFETALITVLALWKFTNLGNVVAGGIATSIGGAIGSSTVLSKLTSPIKLLAGNLGKVFIAVVAGWSIGSAIYEELTGNEADSIPEQIKYLYNSSWKEIKKAGVEAFKEISNSIKGALGLATELRKTENEFFNKGFSKEDFNSIREKHKNNKQQEKQSYLEQFVKTNNVMWLMLYNSIDGYKTGGFPEDGLFFANHNELVGKFNNGKTAVANSYQIEAGIEQASYRGMARALAEHQGNGGNVTVVLQGEADNLFKVVQSKANNYTMQTGKPAFIV